MREGEGGARQVSPIAWTGRFAPAASTIALSAAWPRLYVEETEPDAGRLTRDVDIVVRRADLEKIAAAVGTVGLEYRHAAGADMLVQKGEPSARRVRMKLTSFRLKDQTHGQHLDEAGLITPELEAALSPILRDRLAEVRTHY